MGLKELLEKDIGLQNEVMDMYAKINRKLYINLIIISIGCMIIMTSVFFYFNQPTVFDRQTLNSLNKVDSLLRYRIRQSEELQKEIDSQHIDIDTLKRRTEWLEETLK
jgi:hypothetical protein